MIPAPYKGKTKWGVEGKCRSSVDARESQNPTNSEEYQGHLQGVLYIGQSEETP